MSPSSTHMISDYRWREVRNQDSNQFWLFSLHSCAPLLSVRVAGSVSVVAFRARSSQAHVKTVFHAADNIELLSENCYNNGHFTQVPS